MGCGCFSPSGHKVNGPAEVVSGPPQPQTQPPPPIQADDTKDILNKISQAHPPVEAQRTVATVNIQGQGSADFDADLGSSGGSLRGGRLAFPAGGFVRASSLQAPHRDALRRSVSDRSGLDGHPNGQRTPVLRDAWSRSQAELERAIHAEKARDHADWLPDLQSEEQRLRKRLAKLDLDMKAMRGDGNCQFRAVSFGLYGSQDFHASIREAAVAHMRARKEEYAAFVGESGIDEYLAQMAQAGTWGDELTLRAVSDFYGLVIYCVTSDQHNWFMRYKPPQIKLLQDVFLTYIAPVHYNAIRRQTVSLALRQSLGRSSSSIERAVRRAVSQDMLKSRLSAPAGGAPAARPPLAAASPRPLRLPDAHAAADPAMGPLVEGEHEGRQSVGGSPPSRHRQDAGGGGAAEPLGSAQAASPAQAQLLFASPPPAGAELGAPASPFANGFSSPRLPAAAAPLAAGQSLI